MGAVVHYNIAFSPGPHPSFDAVAQRVRALSGLAIHYEADSMRLSCPTLKLWLCLGEFEGDYFIPMLTEKADYLLVTTIRALQQLGGSFEGCLPPWAGQSWQQLNKWTYRLRRHRIYYPAAAPH